jgi:predicted NAD/FAD-binding protein
VRVAVVGAGIAGLAAARELAPHAEVHLFEAAPRAGGHAFTVEVEEAGRRFPIDLGFIVYNERNYPLFTRLLAELGVATAPSSMGFSVSDRASGIEYSGEGLATLFAAPTNALRPRFWSMLAGLRRFWRLGARALDGPEGRTLAELCDEAGLSEPFRRLFLRPMAGAIWSMPRREVDAFPARTLLRFFHQHGLLGYRGRPQWRTVAGGSRRYVEALLARLDARVHLGAPVERVERTATGVELRVAGERARFDEVVFACHSDTALALLADPSAAEREILGAIRYRSQEIVLHHDRTVLPRRERAWASWNVALDGADGGPIGVTYLMNRLQPLPTATPWCVTLNRSEAIDPGKVRHRASLAHPQFDAAAIAAQERWAEISGRRHTHYAGAYWRHGFHEDGAWSGARATGPLVAGGGARTTGAAAA